MSVIITGISGVGKSFIGNKIASLLQYNVINIGHLILENFSQIHPIDKQRESACDFIGKVLTNDRLIIDMHTVLWLENKIEVCLTYSDILSMRAKAIIVIESDVIRIVQQRLNDAEIRKDRILDDSLQHLHNMQNRQKEVILSLMNTYSIPSIFINNRCVSTEKNISIIQDFIKVVNNEKSIL